MPAMEYAISPITSRHHAPWFLAIGTLVAGWSLPAHAGGIAAGSLIANTATATFQQGTSSETVNSNTVTIKVDELLDVTVSSLDAGNVALTSSGAVLRYQIQNTGNGPEAFTLAADPALAGDDFDAVVSQIAWDSNGNGIYDAGVDAIITAGGATPLLDAEEIGQVFVVANWESPPADGALAKVRLTATATTGSGPQGTVFTNQGEGGGDAVVGAQNATGTAIGTFISHSAGVSLTKSAVIADPFGGTEPVPGAAVTYTITATVSGTGSVANLVVSDVIPSGTTYRAATLKLDGTALSDAGGDDAGTASSSGIAVDLGTVAGGNAHAVTFTVEID